MFKNRIALVRRIFGHEELPGPSGGLVSGLLLLPPHFNKFCYGLTDNLEDYDDQTVDTYYGGDTASGGRL